MKTNIFVNLPVKDLEKTKEFFGGLGYRFDPQFTNQDAACMVIERNIYVMLLTEPFFKKFIHDKSIADVRTSVECITSLSVENKKMVDEWAEKALALGATENSMPDMGMGDTMYGRSLNDLDGHIWEIVWMDPKAVQKAS